MNFDALFVDGQIFLLIFARIISIMLIMPIMSTAAFPGPARAGLAFFTAMAVFPMARNLNFLIPESGILFSFLIIGEVLIGIIMGFIVLMVFTVFQIAGQLFSLQMGFGASQVFDPLAQIQIPLLGQFLNLIAMLVFLVTGGMKKIFLTGVYQSFSVVKASDLFVQQDMLVAYFSGVLGHLFEQAIVIAIPIMGTLILLSVTMGLLAKAAPQMNLLMVGFPIQISVGFIIMLASMPFLIEKFTIIIDSGFEQILTILDAAYRGIL
ncbi:MAG: flagellar biosynthetic protein FliR [Spirochaetaceae bacterium]|jgi:flagellar biosynthetic protein FliR|nr:flagellar biosynthetic protein FliR [Spirochaetaceae bacterium]